MSTAPTLWSNAACTPNAESAAECLARLDPQELPVESGVGKECGIPGTQATLSEVWRHSGWKHARQRVYRAFQSTRQSVTRMAAFCGCGEGGWILQNCENPAEFRLAGNHCHDRLCVPCSADRARAIQHNVCEALRGQFARFLTLTLRGGEVDLAFGIARILKCFRRLRQRRFWRRRVVGGVAFVEFKWSAKSLAWHVHLHVLCHGRFIPKSDLSAEWYDVTGNSYIVDVRAVRQEDKIAAYVTKYVTKPYDRGDLASDDRMCEIVTATHRKRLILAFGDWKDMQLTATPADGDWTVLGDLATVARDAFAGDDKASEALAAVFGDRLSAFLHLAYDAPTTRSPPECPPTEQLRFSWPIIDGRF